MILKSNKSDRARWDGMTREMRGIAGKLHGKIDAEKRN
jgi:hypothetical protein